MPVLLRSLLIEDSADDVLLVVRQLRRAGYDVQFNQVSTREEMEEALRESAWDIVISDFSLPGFGAIEALSIYQQSGLDIPFLVVSGSIGEQRAVEIMRAGAHDYIMKDNMARLGVAIERELRQAANRRESTRTRRSLLESEERYLLLIESVQDHAIFMTDLAGLVTTWNSGAGRVLGYQEDEILGTPVDRLFTAADVRLNIPAQLRDRAIRENRLDDERVHLRGDGASIWVSGTLTSVRDGAGNMHGFVQVMRDATERKRAQQALEKANASLERTNEDLRQLSYAASHDLQEPLRMVTIYSQLLDRHARARLTERERDYLGFALEGAMRIDTLLRSLDEYAQAAEQPQPLRMVDSSAALDSVLLNLQPVLEMSGAIVTRSTLPVVVTHSASLMQVLQNLIGNAVKYRRNDPPDVHVSAENHADEWVFCVEDNGIGIEPRHLKRLFGIFKRLHRDEYPGAGIGLALCKRLVERMGGRIWVESVPGAGSAFRFAIPKPGGRPIT